MTDNIGVDEKDFANFLIRESNMCVWRTFKQNIIKDKLSLIWNKRKQTKHNTNKKKVHNMPLKTRVTEMLNIEHPVVMVSKALDII